MTAHIPLPDSLTNLKKTAQSFDDIQRWLMENQQVFSGIKRTLNTEIIDVECEVDTDFAYGSLEETDTLVVVCRLWLLAQWDVEPCLSEFAPLSDNEVETAIPKEYSLKLKMGDWPFATAYVTGKYFSSGWHIDDESPWAAGYNDVLDGHLQQHFPGYSLAKIEALINADLIPFDEDSEENEIHAVIDTLFSARHAPEILNPPSDLLNETDRGTPTP